MVTLVNYGLAMGQPVWNVTVGTLLFLSLDLFSWAGKISEKRIFWSPPWKGEV